VLGLILATSCVLDAVAPVCFNQEAAYVRRPSVTGSWPPFNQSAHRHQHAATGREQPPPDCWPGSV